MKTAIVCEGGGMRGVFTAGVLQAFMNAGFVPDEVVGVSAGASNLASFVSGQAGRGYRTNVNYAGDPRYCSIKSYLTTGSVFGMDFIFGDIPEELDPFDYAAFAASPTAYYAGATQLSTGKVRYFGKESIVPGLAALRASCSMPLASPVVEIDGEAYLDGGVAEPIPIDKALRDGCEKLVVVLTRPRGYHKKPQALRAAYQLAYRQYPNFVRAMRLRHFVYNHCLQRLWRLEAEGRAVVALPAAPLEVDRFGKDADKLIAAYNEGLDIGRSTLLRL